MNSNDMERLAVIMASEGLNMAMFSNNPKSNIMTGWIHVEMEDDGEPFAMICSSFHQRFTHTLVYALTNYAMGLTQDVMES